VDRREKPQTASISAETVALSKALKEQGWKFVGPPAVYASMQATGLIVDYVEDCVIRAKVERARSSFRRPGRWRLRSAKEG
jgi:DNA-3-methyladenine glycosylase I